MWYSTVMVFRLTFSIPNCASVHHKSLDLFNGTTLFCEIQNKILYKFSIHLAFTGRKHYGQYKRHLIQSKIKTPHFTNSVFVGFASFSKWAVTISLNNIKHLVFVMRTQCSLWSMNWFFFLLKLLWYFKWLKCTHPSLNAITRNISNVMAPAGVDLRHVPAYKDTTSLSKCIFILMDIRTYRRRDFPLINLTRLKFLGRKPVL